VTGDSLFSLPKQRRSRETFDRILEAATELLQEVGYDAMRIAEVSERANVGTASIYARVGSKHGLMLAVQARMVQELDRNAEMLLIPLLDFEGSVDALVFSAVGVVGELFRRHAALLRVFMIRADVDSDVIEHGSASSVRLSELFADVLLARRSAIAHADPARAVDVAFRLVYDTLARRLVRGEAFESRRELAWEDLVEELAVACAAYLTHAAAIERP
jgi:AcrR family transcriptional regulator